MMRALSVKRAMAGAVSLCLSCALLVGGASAKAGDAGFSDVASDAWYADAVTFVTDRGLFTGVPGGRFDPNGTMDRAMLSAVLQRMALGAGLISGTQFTDVPDTAWYADAAAWASANGVMQGSSSATFAPGMTVTREQLAATLYNFARFRGEDTAATADLGTYPDAADVSAWAKEAMSWAVGAGVVSGTGAGQLAPKASASRAEVAAVLQRCAGLWDKDVSVKGMTALYNPVSKVVALSIEYPENVTAPKAEDITITDYETQLYNGANERCDSASAQVTAVYTNSAPELRVDQKSVEGKYVIVELADPAEAAYDEADGLWHTTYAGVANVRYAPGMKEGVTTTSSMFRPDWDNYVVQVKADVKNADGKVVCTAGTLPAMKAEEVTDLSGVDEFRPVDFTSARGNPVYSMLRLPADYDAAQSYPLVVECSGGSQRLEFGADGQPLNLYTGLNRDTGAVGWLRVTDDVIVLSLQPQKNPPYAETYDEYEDTYELIEHILETYSVDQGRVYCAGSSYGTLHLSTVIARHPELFTAYVQCNGNFVGANNMWIDEYDKPKADYTDESKIKPDSEYYDAYKAALQGVVDNEVKIWVCHGANDGTAPITRGVTTYKMLERMYREKGKTPEEIDGLVRLSIYTDEEMLAKGIFNYHDAFRMATADVDLMTWVLEQTKSGEEVVLTKNLPRAEEMEIDLDDYYGQVIQGYYNYDCVVSGGVTRTAKFYIPDGTVYNQPTVFVGVPDGVDTYQFLVDSGWKALADKEIFHVVLMEPENGKWGKAEDEIAYISALNQDVSYRPFFCAFSSNFYGVAYGECADFLQAQSVNSPKSWAGIVVLGASGMTADEVKAIQAAPSKVPGVTLAEAQTPAWIVAEKKTDDVERLVDFYKSANHSQATKASAKYADEVYLPQKGGTVDDQWCANTVFDAADWRECVNETYSQSIYTELFKGVYRYPGDANGALRRPGDIADRGFEKFEAQVPGGFQADGSDLYNREWYVYVPDSVDTSKPAPLVFVFHGAGGSGNEIADRSGWAQVADEKGFIIVCPTGSHTLSVRRVSDMVTNELFRAMWNTGDATADRPSDLKFVEYLYDWMVEKYEIDSSRVYASGQSSGGMMTWACAAKLPGLFAAAAPVSATRGVEPVEGPLMPIKAYIGEEDTTFPGGFGSDDGKEAVGFWTQRNGTVEQWDSYTYMDGGKDRSSRDGLFTNYVFQNADGVPMLHCVEVATKTHAIWPSECFDAWDTWFSHFTKDPGTGALSYDGKPVK